MSTLSSLSSLLSSTALTDHSEILHAANAALKKSKSDIDAQHVRAVALLKLDRFDDALRVFDEAGDALKQRARLEWAYALYKSGEFKRAEEVAAEAEGTGGRGVRHVRAQATYRLEDFQRAAELYRGLDDGSAAARQEANDLRINAGAVDAQLEWAGQGRLVRKKKPAREDLEQFETAYNAACGSVARGEVGQAEVLLRRARGLCEALEDLSEEEKRAEILPIMVQQVYVLTRQGRLDEAEKMAESIAIPDIPDLSTRHLARINALAASTHPTNPYLSHRLFHSSGNLPKTDRTFTFQSSLLLQNTLSVLNAAAHAHLRTDKPGLKAVLALLEDRPDDVGLLLTAMHLYLLTNNHGAATALLEAFFARLEQSTESHPEHQAVRFAPGLVGTLTTLYERQRRDAHVRRELGKAARYWRRRAKETGEGLGGVPSLALLKAAGAKLLESSKQEELLEVAGIFKDLHEHDPSDRGSVAGLVAAYAATGRLGEVRPELLEQLTPVPRLVADIDAAALEDAGVARAAPTVASAEDGARKRPATADKDAPKKARKTRKGRLPKEFVEGKTPDPERWLPMRDRSYYKPKGRKGKKRAEGLTQGGVVEEKEKGAATAVVGGGGGGKKGKGKKKGAR